MPFCPSCGSEVDAAIVLAAAAGADRSSDEVEIARINAERDVEVARLAARQDNNWNETRVEVAEIEAAAEVEVATAEAEILGDAIEAMGAADETAPDESDSEPIVIADPAPDTGESLAPPEVESHREPKAKSPLAWNYA